MRFFTVFMALFVISWISFGEIFQIFYSTLNPAAYEFYTRKK